MVCYFPHGQPFYRVEYSSFKEYLEELIEEWIDNLLIIGFVKGQV